MIEDLNVFATITAFAVGLISVAVIALVLDKIEWSKTSAAKRTRKKAAKALVRNYDELVFENSEQQKFIDFLQEEVDKRDETINTLKAKLKVEKLCENTFPKPLKAVPDIEIVVAELPKDKIKTVWDKPKSIFTPYKDGAK